MREVIQKWYDWLKQATSNEKEELAHVHSDGRQLWATDGYRLHARQIATDKQGRVTVGETGLFQVGVNGQTPDFAASLPKTQPAATVIVERDKLLQALAGQDNHVRLTLYADDQALELSSAGAYALVMPLTGLEEPDFWRPEIFKE
jgi:DNA polymerase III sliding clamp (beta) subunit (PCNA family)